MKIIIVAIGSQGDVNPFLGIGKALQGRGHDVTVLANSYFETLIHKTGLRFHSVGSSEDYERLTKTVEVSKARNALPAILKSGYFPHIRDIYSYIDSHSKGDKTVILGGTLPFGAWLAKEKLKVPLITLHLSPFSFRSSYRVPVGYPALKQWMPKWYKDMFWRLIDINFDRIVIPELNKLREEIGLGPEGPNFMKRRRDFADIMIGLFPQWFAYPQKDWPQKLVFTGFPFFDDGVQPSNVQRLQNFLSEGERPVVFTPGTAIRSAEIFFQNSLETCEKMGLRGIFLTRYPEQIPRNLPMTVCHFDYIPLDKLLPSAAAIVSHGGIGTCAQALRAGIPHLVMPHVHDQFDNASRLITLGVGDALSVNKYKTDNVVKKLKILLNSDGVKQKCKEIADKIKESSPIEIICSVIESIVNK